MSQPVSPGTFPMFEDLPLDLKIIIWDLAILVPRVVHLRGNSVLDDSDRRSFWACTWDGGIESETMEPGVLMACKQSRLQALKVYSPLRIRASKSSIPLKPKGPRISVNFERDTIHFRKADDEPFLLPYYVDFVKAASLAAIKHVVLDYHPAFDVGSSFHQTQLDEDIASLPLRFPSLETLSFLEGDMRDLPSDGSAEIVKSKPPSHRSGIRRNYYSNLEKKAGLLDEDRKRSWNGRRETYPEKKPWVQSFPSMARLA